MRSSCGTALAPRSIFRQGHRVWHMLGLFAAMLFLAARIAPAAAEEAQPVQQLRAYEIFDNNKAAFHERFRDKAMPIMKRYGFHIIGMWETREDDRPLFVYLLQWPDEATMRSSWKSFLADPEWTEIKRVTGAQHGRMVGKVRDLPLTTLAHSPVKIFATDKQGAQ